MGLFQWLGKKLFGDGEDDGILRQATGAAEDIKTMVTDRLPPEQRAEFEQKHNEIVAGLARGQQEINKTEAQHRSVFVAGWRPFIGWVAGLTFFYNMLVRQIARDMFGADLPPVDNTQVSEIVLGLLGIGYMAARTREKERGVQDRH